MSIGIEILYYFLIFLNFALRIYSWVFIIYIIMSWFPVNPDNFFVKFIRGLCQPLYNWVRKVLPPLRLGMFDFTIVYIIIFIHILSLVFQRLIFVIEGG